MKYCATCNLEYPDTSRFCKSCGNQLGETATGSLPPEPPPALCPSCSAPVGGGWKFCKQCGYAFDEVTLVRGRTSQFAPTQAATVVAPPPPTVVAVPIPAQAPPKEAECGACGHRSAPGAQTCEAGGAPVGSFARKRRVKRIGIAAAVTLVVVVLASPHERK